MPEHSQNLFDVEDLLSTNHRKIAGEQLNHGTRTLMVELLRMDIKREVIIALLEMVPVKSAHIQYLAGPIIVHKSPWAETSPPWLLKAVVIDRLETIFAEYHAGVVKQLATSSEILAYMMPATMDAPMQRDWVDVYTWAGNETLIKHKRLNDGQTFWDLTGEKAVAFDMVKHNYETLARDIREKVVDLAKLHGWGKKARRQSLVAQGLSEDMKAVEQLELGETSSGETSESVVPPMTAPDIVQLSLF